MNALPPYQVHLHRRLSEEIPELPLVVISTHRDADRNWQSRLAPGVTYVDLSGDEPIPSGIRGHFGRREWRRGGELIQELKRLNPAAVIVCGYYDVARMRILRWGPAHGVPTFIWGDSNVLAESGKNPWFVWAKKQFIRRLTRPLSGCLACGSMGVAYWNKYDVNTNKIFVIPLECDYDEIQKITSP